MNHLAIAAGLLAGSVPLTIGLRASQASTLWADLDGDGHEDLVLVSQARLRLLFADANGQLVPADARAGLDELRGVRAASVTDVDADGRLELFLVSVAGPHRLLSYVDGAFVDRASTAGLADLGAIEEAVWQDYDGDGDADLVLTSPDGGFGLWHNDGAGFFDELALPASLDALGGADMLAGAPASTDGASALEPSEGAESSRRTTVDRDRSVTFGEANRRVADAPRSDTDRSLEATAGTGQFGTSAQIANGYGFPCASSVRDQAGGACLEASSNPVEGSLYPLTQRLMVATNGWIGINRLDPQANLHVHGGAPTHMRLSSSGLFGPSEAVLQMSLGSDFEEGMSLRTDDAGFEISSQRKVGPGGANSVEFGPHLFVSRAATTAVGIGEDSPETTLHVGGDTTLEDTVHITRDDGVETATIFPQWLPGYGGTLFLNDSNGNQGIRMDGQLGTGSFLRMNRSDGFGSVTIDADDGGAAVMRFFKADNSVGVTIDANQGGDARITTQVLEITGGADLVEAFDTGDAVCAPGTVVVIDPERPGELAPSSTPYDARVAGIVSGAGGIQAGLRLGQEGVASGSTPVALTGRVYVQSTDENGVIQPGDMLTTSSMAGTAMRATDRERSFGAILGKAMTAADPETGLVLVLVNLQ